MGSPSPTDVVFIYQDIKLASEHFNFAPKLFYVSYLFLILLE